MSGLLTAEDCQSLVDKINARHEKLEEYRLAPPHIRFWDGDMTLRGHCEGWLSVEYEFIENDTGTCAIELPVDHYLAQWIMNHRGRAKRNVIVTIDKQGSRWSGIMDSYKVIKTKEQHIYLRAQFKHDFEQLKHIYCWANPFLRPEFQFPKLWIIFGPAKFCLLTTLFVNLLRLETSLWTLPDNPLDIMEWMGPSFIPTTWRNIVKPYDPLSDNSPMTIVFSRFQSFFEIAEMVLKDAQLTIECRRYLKDEDPHPFSDLEGTLIDNNIVEGIASLLPLRHGCVVWDIKDKSGWGSETAFGGSLAVGLLRTFVNIASDGYTEGVEVYSGPHTDPGEYANPFYLGTNPRAPHVVFEEGLYTGIIESEFEYYEATDTSFIAGGKSMPGINEGISAAINMGGDFLTSLINTLIGEAAAVSVGGGVGGTVGVSVPPIDIPPLGGIIDTLARPIYEDVIAAFMEVPTLRAAGLSLPIAGLEDIITGLGDFHYYEAKVDDDIRAFTLGAMAATRAKIWETRAKTSHSITIPDAAPYLIGEQGYGHFWLGDRICTNPAGWPDPMQLFVERVHKIGYKWDQDGPKGWNIEVGYREPQDPAFKALELIKRLTNTIGQLGFV